MSAVLPRVDVHVSIDGDDGWDGCAAVAGGEGSGPFATIRRALAAVRERRCGGALPAGGATIRIGPGRHCLGEALCLGEADSGTAVAPLVIAAEPGADVWLSGGVRIPFAACRPVTDAAVRNRLAPAVRDRVLEVDLAAAGVGDPGTLVSRGFGRETQTAAAELFVDGIPMQLARWPQPGAFARIAGPAGKPPAAAEGTGTPPLADGFHYHGDHPRRWATHRDIWVHGYWAWDWADTYEQVDSIDLDQRLVRTRPPYGQYHFRANQRFYFLNVLEELDRPGEYYIDRDCGILYFLPVEPVTASTEILVSALDRPLVDMTDASHVVLRGLGFEATRSHGIRIRGGSGNLVVGCTIRNVGNWGVRVEGGTGHRVTGCTITDTGDGGIDLDGGNRQTLEPANHAADNNHIHHYARWCRSYMAGVRAGGVGHRIAHNRIHDAPHNAVLYWGNEIAVEFNEIYRVCMESGDVGAIYTGRDYSFRGNRIRANFIHHIGGVDAWSSAIYMDDAVSGHEIRDNIVWGGDGIWLGGGCDFVIENNVFVDCRHGISVDSRGAELSWRPMIRDTMGSRLEAVNWRQPPYSTRYPELAALVPYFEAEGGVPPFNNRIERNVAWRGGWLRLRSKLAAELVQVRDNIVDRDPGFVDPDRGDFRLRPDSPLPALRFAPIPVDRIGLIVDEYRTAIPPRTGLGGRWRLLEPPRTYAGDDVAVGHAELEVINLGETPVAGMLDLRASPPRLRFAPAAVLPFTLAPGERATWQVEIAVTAAGPPAEAGAFLAGQALPVCTLAVAAEEAAMTPFCQQFLVSEPLPSAGRLEALACPRCEDLKMTARVFDGDGFCNVYDDWATVPPQDRLIVFACRLDCPEAMTVALLLGYDGPVKLFVDGEALCHDPHGINPGVPDTATPGFAATAGSHDIVVALGSNHGRACGIFLRCQRRGLAPAALAAAGLPEFKL